ncbi:MAG: cation:proton antiporter [Deltaproteobacteria bacterium]|nr:cation:proton antiporter [Deltaproteobacteria bacterium]
MEYGLLLDIIYILAISAVALFLCNRIRIPAIVGFLLVGILVGPAGLHVVHAVHAVDQMAEIGVVLLMFTIGIEFSLESLLKIKKTLLLGGIVQTSATFALVCGSMLLTGMSAPAAVFVGMIVTLSSTAIVMRSLQNRGEIDTPHGRTALGILIFQDLLAIPMMLAVPLLAGSAGLEAQQVFAFVIKAAAFLIAVIVSARWILPGVLHQIGRTRDSDLFLITVILMGFGIAYASYSVGLSLAFGAFLAGLILSESQYGQRALGNILPLRDMFMGFFFVSIGMMLSPATIIATPGLVFGRTVLLMALKGAIVAGTSLLLGLPLRSAVICGLTLAQVGEFSFVIATAGLKAGLLVPQHFQIFLGASIFSMMATPLLIMLAPRFAEFFLKLPLPRRLKFGSYSDEPKPQLHDHLVIIGFGLNGRHMADAAAAAHIPHVIIDANSDTVRQERSSGRRIYHGDAACEPILIHAGIPDARVAVVAISDPVGTNRIVEQIRLLNPAIHIIARVRYIVHAERLLALGANEIIPEEYESSIELFTRVLHKYLVPKDTVEDMIARIRADGYQMLRSPNPVKTGLQDLESTLSGMEIRSMRVQHSSNAVGHSLAELNLRKEYGIAVLAISRRGQKVTLPDGDDRFQEGDTVVLLGLPELLLFADNIFNPR